MAIREITNGWDIEATQVVRYRAYKVDHLLSRPIETAHYFGADPYGARRVRRLFVIDRTIEKLYGAEWRAYCGAAGITPSFMSIECRESVKTGATVSRIIDELMTFGLSRDHAHDDDRPLIEVWGVGGGVLHDVLGKAVMEVDRGIYGWGFVATNALSNFDAGYGGKVMENYAGRKNARGGINPPKRFISDLSFLVTVAPRHIAAGLAEVIKVGTFHDRHLLKLMHEHGAALVRGRLQETDEVSKAVINEVRDRAIFPMLEEQGDNLWVQKARRWQEGGHDAAHEWELAVCDEILHGEAVAMNLAVISFIAEARRECDYSTADMIRETLFRTSLPLYDPVMENQRYVEQALRRAVAKRGTQAIPIVTTEGYAIADDLRVSEYMVAVGQAKRWVAARQSRPRL